MGGVQHSCASTLTRRPSLTGDVDDVASQLLLANHETPLKVHGVFDESFGPKCTKSIGDEEFGDPGVLGTRNPQAFHIFHILQAGLVSSVAVGVYAGRRISVHAQLRWIRGPGGAMIAIPGVTTEVATFAAGNRHAARISAKSAALVVAAAVMWLTVLAILTVV